MFNLPLAVIWSETKWHNEEWRVEDAAGEILMSTQDEPEGATLDWLVARANAHDALVEACQQAFDVFDSWMTGTWRDGTEDEADKHMRWIKQAQSAYLKTEAALALARGET